MSGLQVVSTAPIACTFGLGPSIFNATPHMTMSGFLPSGNVMDNVFGMNIMPFPMCHCPANPTVIAATAAALGVPTPAACVGVFPGPWTPGATKMMLDKFPALDMASTLACTWGGVVSVIFAGEATNMIA